MSATTTMAPSLANISALARPMPLPAPVMIQTLSCNLPMACLVAPPRRTARVISVPPPAAPAHFQSSPEHSPAHNHGQSIIIRSYSHSNAVVLSDGCRDDAEDAQCSHERDV